jgi:bifunctional non-homologous end joining protein LigD
VFKRSQDWVKVKCKHSQEMVIAGFTAPKGSRQAFGALLLGFYDKKKQLQYAGKVGTGFTEEKLNFLLRKLKKYVQSKPAFINPPTGFHAENVTWLKPKLVAEIEFSEWTKNNRLRHPSFQALRQDKPASEVVRE